MSLQLPDYDIDWVAVDTETSGLHPDDHARVACVALTWSEYHPAGDKLVTRALPFDQGIRDKFASDQLELGLSFEDPNLGQDEWTEMLDWLSEQRLVFHNAKFDLTMLRAGTRHWDGRDLSAQLHWDTMLAQRELDPTEKVGLDVTCQRLGIGEGKEGLDAAKGWLKRNKLKPNRYDLVPWSIIRKYVSTDTELTAELYQHQWRRLEEMEVADANALVGRVETELDLLRTLYEMEKRGLGYDAARSREAADVLLARADAIEKRMPFEVKPKQGKFYFFKTLGLQADRVSDKTGEPSLDEQQIRKWAKQDVKWAKEWAEVTRLRRAVSMWYGGYPDLIGSDGRLRCSFRQGHVKSGRMSVERVQLQAMPKADKYSAVGSNETLEIFEGVPQVREMIQPKEGHGLWSLDLSQAELRVAAQYSGCKRMLDQLLNGEDIHGNTAQQVLGASPGAPDWKTQRDIAKRTTFGGIFMVGAKTFQETLAKLADIHLTEQECWKIINGWRRMYPEIGATHKKAEQFVIENGYVRVLPNTEYERKSWFSDYDYAVSGTRSAWNRIVQGSLAEAFKLLLIETEKNWPGYLVLTVHDSVVLECPEDEGDQIAAEVAAMGSELMTGLFNVEMGMDVDRW